MNKKVTINDIAMIANVAKSTVSRYLNGGSVSVHTREKLDGIVKKYNYTPNTFAQSLKQQTNHTIGVIVPRLDSIAQSDMLRGLDELNIDDTFLIINVYQDSTRELAAIEKLQSQNVSGLIILTANLTEEIRSVIKASKLPTVIQGQDEAEFNRVIMNDIQAGKTVGNYLQKLAPKNVLLLNVDMSLDYAVGHDRFVGIKSALSGIPHKEIITDFKLNIAKQSAYQAMIHEDFDLIIGATDRIVVGAMQSAFALHQKPRYIGFGQSYFSETVSPNLTSFEFSFFEAGKELYRLFRKVRDNNSIQIQRVVIDGKLIIRDSTN
ncbi:MULTISPECIES: LacI family DNA-binding transcriptional regulator [Leuconostoc]|uniref:LacI family DNA-binding transcriptional regulator n=1 Tax=Leuconostoc gelidum subsp. gelidum TaxID=1607839 RepID=A0ABS7V3D3_LEUGE|nr:MULTISPECIES: LacI family DNA-binding transcriptional regulator [Leuconostoc]AFS40196.1 sucrose operon repressor [Leuconostoc gelidum JB7]MBZ5964294.1 LacI family DNA-binding transcriptional regulator [Leuconostoc gelidum subsp. gelidum]MBZ5975107.1 LacI family DNA-binding transcriptional regulator [Leuconostoc gelidum subsp. gelidum]MBZ5976943.1 LacI family DNA-binding transcriptional regulator [Leuconostoc gelidum subsp. gelidum]MBZ5978110.1 LacI family DNA-binding transcriptional regulat